MLVMGLLISKPKKKTKKVPEFATVHKIKTPKKSPRKKITNGTVRLSTPASERQRHVQRWFNQNAPNSKKQLKF